MLWADDAPDDATADSGQPGPRPYMFEPDLDQEATRGAEMLDDAAEPVPGTSQQQDASRLSDLSSWYYIIKQINSLPTFGA